MENLLLLEKDLLKQIAGPFGNDHYMKDSLEKKLFAVNSTRETMKLFLNDADTDPMDLDLVNFEDGIDVYIFDGWGQSGERWQPVSLSKVKRPYEHLYLLFGHLAKGRTVMLVRKEDTGILWSATFKGKDRDMNPLEFVRLKEMGLI